MVTILMLAMAITAQNSTVGHVRTTEPRILALIETGLSRSATFRRLVETLNESDVIVYVEQKLGRDEFGGYLDHNITNTGAFRYVRLKIETKGQDIRLISVLAHELQHAVEVAASPDARDAVSMARAFGRLGTTSQCGNADCFETRAAIHVEDIVGAELKAARSPARAASVPPDASAISRLLQ